MSTINARHIRILDGLIAATLESAQFYAAVAETGMSPHFQTLFEQRAVARGHLAATLQAEIGDIPGTPREGNKGPALVPRIFRDLGSPVATVAEAVEAHERTVKKRFAEILHAQSLPHAVARVVNHVYAEIQADKDRLRIFVHSLTADAQPAVTNEGRPQFRAVCWVARWRPSRTPVLVGSRHAHHNGAEH
jgi:uncharacterized protein (TIGR02284 family)